MIFIEFAAYLKNRSFKEPLWRDASACFYFTYYLWFFAILKNIKDAPKETLDKDLSKMQNFNKIIHDRV